MWPLPPQFPLCRNCRKPGKGSQETVTTDHIGGQQEMYYRLLTFQSRHLHLWTWPQDYLIFFIARDIWDRRAEDFLCHPFISYQVLCKPPMSVGLCHCVPVTSDNGISWYQRDPQSAAWCPCSWPGVYRGQMLTTDHAPCCDTGARGNWSQHLNWLTPLYETISSNFVRTKTLCSPADASWFVIWADGWLCV